MAYKLRPEEALQIATVQMLRLAFPRLMFFHVPNEKGTRTAFEMMHLNRMGVRAGAADLIFCLPGGRFGAIELKAGKGKQTDGQESFQSAVVAAKGLYAVCRTTQEVYSTLMLWGAKG